MADIDRPILDKACEVEDFFGAFFKDSLDDWSLVREVGELFVRIGEYTMGRALQARAQRHLGDLEQAREELKRCQVMVSGGELVQEEAEMFVRFLAEEKSTLGE